MSMVPGNPWGSQAGFVEQVATPGTFQVDITATINSIVLDWSPVEGAIRYVVYCGLSPQSMSPVVDGLQDNGCEIGGLTSGQTYYVQVMAVFSARSAIASYFPGLGGGGGGSIGGVSLPLYIALLIDPHNYLSIDDAGNVLLINGAASCSPLAADVCYKMIQVNAAPLTSQTLGPDGNSPYSVDVTIDWSNDAVCGFNVLLYLDDSIFFTINHLNIPLNNQKQRRVVVTVASADSASTLTTFSSPALSSGTMPAGIWGVGQVLTIDFFADCGGNISSAVTYPANSWNPSSAVNVQWVLSNNNETATCPSTAEGCSAQSLGANVPALAYAEVLCTTDQAFLIYGDSSLIINAVNDVSANSYGISQTGTQALQAGLLTLPHLNPGDVVQIAFNQNTQSLWFGVNNAYFNGGNPGSGTNPTYMGVGNVPQFIAASTATDGTAQYCAVTLRTSASSFTQPVPAGFSSWAGN